jgi:hypothetical protein
MEDKRLTLKQVEELRSKWMDGGCPGSLIDVLESAGAFKSEPLADGLYVCRLIGPGPHPKRNAMEILNGKWRWFETGEEISDSARFIITPYARLTETPI